MSAPRAALARFIDYAGLFPPAALDLRTTIDSHERYASSPERWMLGRLVLPLARLDEVATTLAESPDASREWAIAALVAPGDRFDDVAASIDRFHAAPGTRGVIIGAVEAVLPGPAGAAELTAHVGTLDRFIEVPLDATRDTWLDAIAAAGCSAKVRTGGLTADRFPSPAALAGLLQACASRDLPLKATAGLHHAIRDAYPLTYEPESPTGVMHGFVNLLVAALLVRTGIGTPADAQRALETRDPGQFTVRENAIGWEGHTFSADACADTRARLLRSVGSCSFEEPVAELRALGWRLASISE